MKRVLVMGCPGAGKARLAARLGHITDLDVYHIKDDRFSEKHTEDEKAAWMEAVRKIVEKDSWIIEGTQSISYKMRMDRADTVFFITEKPMKCLGKFIKRSFKRKLSHRRDRMHISRDMFKKILAYRKTMRPIIDDLIEKNKTHLEVKFFSCDEEIDEFLIKTEGEYKVK